VNAPTLRISATQKKAIEKRLCGMSDCMCGKFDSVKDNNGEELEIAHEEQDGRTHFWYKVV